MDLPLPFPALLSQVLVAFTIEFDNEAELRLAHRTSRQGGYGTWLASLVMWSNCMRFVTVEGVTVRELERLARTPTNLPGMQRWGYVTVQPGPGKDRTVRATYAGHRARDIWAPLFGEIEARWEERFGKAAVSDLRAGLDPLVQQLDPDLPDSMPILRYGLRCDLLPAKQRAGGGIHAEPTLIAMLSKTLLTFALDYEAQSEVSLAIGSNVLRLAVDAGVRMRDLPALSGVSKEQIAVATGWLVRNGYAEFGTESKESRFKVLSLTRKGEFARHAFEARTAALKEQWKTRFGNAAISHLRDALERIATDPALLDGLEPHPENWRAKAPRKKVLPWFPAVTHRGGYPDGS